MFPGIVADVRLECGHDLVVLGIWVSQILHCPIGYDRDAC
jgi:hypothetical protein